MATVRKDDWIEAGFTLLREEGHRAVTVDALCNAVGRTKGSFYHHFDGREHFAYALLQAWERRATGRLMDAVEGGGSPAERLRRLNREAAEGGLGGIERAIRAWAHSDPGAASVQERVDAMRLARLEDVVLDRTGRPEDAALLARVFQLVFVGAQHLDPPLDGPALYATFRALDPLFDAGTRASETGTTLEAS